MQQIPRMSEPRNLLRQEFMVSESAQAGKDPRASWIPTNSNHSVNTKAISPSIKSVL